MQKTIHANKRRILAILLCIAVIAGCLPFSAQEAYAASGTVNYKKGAVLEYGSHWTNFMYVDGNRFFHDDMLALLHCKNRKIGM